MNKLSKRAALELSVNTIVIIVLAITMLIIGMVLVRNIMCGALNLTTDINSKVRGEINRLFGQSAGEVQCIGASGEPVQMVPGQINFVYCAIQAKQASDYGITATVQSVPEGITITRVMQSWVKSSSWSGRVSPGDQDPQKVMRLDIPGDAPEGLLTVRAAIKKNGADLAQRDLDFEIKRVGLARATVC